MKAFLQYLLYLLTGRTAQQQQSAPVLKSVASRRSIAELNANGVKAAQAKQYLGTKWLLHPANRVQRKSTTSWTDVRPFAGG